MLWFILTLVFGTIFLAGLTVFIFWVSGFGKSMDDAWGYALRSQKKAIRRRRKK